MTKPHEPDEKTRKTVESMSSYGIPQEDIARVLDIDSKTLRLYYRYELDTAEVKANTMVASRLYEKCMKGESASIMFWLKTRGRWKETTVNEHTGANGQPLMLPTEISIEIVDPKE